MEVASHAASPWPKTDTDLVGIMHSQVDFLWPDAEPLLEKALWRTGAILNFHTADIYHALKRRDMQMWAVFKEKELVCVAITQIIAYPQRKVLTLPFLGAKKGTINGWLGHLRTLQAFGEEHGCTALKGWGRPGWVRRLGPTQVGVEFFLEFADESVH